MKIVLTTVGTTGDVLPYVALGQALVKRGHSVLACASNVHRHHFEKHGIEFRAIGGVFTIESFNRVLEGIAQLTEPFAQFELLAEQVFLAEPERQFADQLEATRGADVVVAHWFDYLAQEAAIKNKVKWLTMTYMPEVFRTMEAPVYPYPRLGRWWTKLTWDRAEDISMPLRARIAVLLGKLGCSPRPLAIAGALSPKLNLLAASKHLVEVRSDWPASVKLTGSWFLDEPEYRPSRELAAFLAKHPKPIVVTFGSMGGQDTRASTDLVRDALDRADHPAIVQKGYGGLDASANERIFAAEFVPHDWLFAHAGCVVHHAGSGTSAAVARSGAPSVPVPHHFDQYYWAGMLARVGAATKPIFRNQLTAKALASSIREALASPRLRDRAGELAKGVREERGVDVAVEAIEQYRG